VRYEVPAAKLEPGLYRNISGNTALALGFVAAARKAGITLFQGSYPITPASDILHELSMYKEFGVTTFQAEDEIAAMTSSIGSAPWKIPTLEQLPEIRVRYRTEREGFMPYTRDPNTLARPWAVPGTPGLEHRIGGLEKQDVTGNVNYEPLNHERMVRLRAAKVAAVVQDVPDVVPAGDPDGDLLLVGWGSTFGPITAAL